MRLAQIDTPGGLLLDRVLREAGFRRDQAKVCLAMHEESWTWPDSLDALVAAAESHRCLFENDNVRVLETKIAPGETTQVHTHRWPGVLYILSFGDFVRRDSNGKVLVDTRDGGTRPAPGSAIWSDALPPHTLQNVDTSEIHVIGIELKRA